jgi:tetratricopeptide (TPR) repeat protein
MLLKLAQEGEAGLWAGGPGDRRLVFERYARAGRELDGCLARGMRTAAVYQARGLIHQHLAEHTGDARQRLAEYAAALECYSAALTLGRDATALAQRGWVYLKLEAPLPALADFDAALELDRKHPDALDGRALALVMRGRVADGVAAVERALNQGRPTLTVLFDAACVYAQAAERDPLANPRTLQRYREEAVERLRQALERVPPAGRAAFWRERVDREPALRSLRQTGPMRVLARKYAR